LCKCDSTSVADVQLLHRVSLLSKNFLSFLFFQYYTYDNDNNRMIAYQGVVDCIRSVSFKNVKSCADFPDSDRSDRLRSELHHYLECQPPSSVVTNGTLTFARESEALTASTATELVATDVCVTALPVDLLAPS